MLLLILLISSTALAQPEWVSECPKGSYDEFYFCGFSINREYQTALMNAFANTILKIEKTSKIDPIKIF